LTAEPDDYKDKSRKGSVDVRALPIIRAINARSDMFTTSSCSGRISVFAEPTAATRLAGKKGGEWVYASHDPAVRPCSVLLKC
jgi:tRNA wybutosine-synthesizing protein 3